MKLFRPIAEKLTKAKFQRNDWRIIENIAAQDFERIIQTYREKGWEFRDAYQSFNAELKKWQCKLRKGNSTLRCEWQAEQKGRIYGPSRPVSGLGKEFNFSVLETPSRR